MEHFEHRFSSLDFQPVSPSPACLPLEIIHLLADTFFPTTVAESSELSIGHTISLVCRSWRKIGQGLLFRHLSVRSLSSTCPRLRHFLSPSFAHACRVKLLLVDVSGSQHQASSLLPLLDRCRNLENLALYGPPRDISYNVKDLSLSSARHTVTTLAPIFEQVQNRKFEECDVENFLLGIDNLAALKDLQIQIPVAFGRLLSPFEHRIKVAKFGLCICSSGDEKPKDPDFEHTTTSILSLLSQPHLEELKLLPTSFSQSFVASLPLYTSFSSMSLVSFNQHPTRLLTSLLHVLPTLVPLQTLSIHIMEGEEEDPSFASIYSSFLQHLPPRLKTLDLDYSVSPSTVTSLEKLLMDRQEGRLHRVTWVECPQGKRISRRRVNINGSWS